MNNKTTFASTTYTILLIILIANSCKKDGPVAKIDTDLYQMAKVTTNITWYKNSNVLLNRSTGSGHSFSLLRTRYNDVASLSLDSNGKVLSGSDFAEGSFIVKELFDNATSLGRYAILYKQTANTNADDKGWIWGYVNADGSVAESAENKGSACKGCHSQAGNIDYMLMNKFFP